LTRDQAAPGPASSGAP